MEKKYYAEIEVTLTSCHTSDAQPSQRDISTLESALKALLSVLRLSSQMALPDDFETHYDSAHTPLHRHTLRRQLVLRSVSEHRLHHQIQVVIHYLALFDIQCELVLTGRLEPEA